MASGDSGSFEAQAAAYDARTGLPPGVGAAVAQAIAADTGAGRNDLVLELGAGTGEIGVHLARLPIRYLGLDSSPAMLDVFRAKAGAVPPPVTVADCNETWPLPEASARVIFASRVVHLLQPGHVVQETLRVGQPGGRLLLGRVQREPGSLKERLQQQRQHLLRAAGFAPRQGDRGARHVIDACVHAGCKDQGRLVAAAWSGETSVAAILAGWASLSRMGSVEVDADTRARILADLQTWAAHEFGDLESAHPYRELYILDIVQLPAQQDAQDPSPLESKPGLTGKEPEGH